MWDILIFYILLMWGRWSKKDENRKFSYSHMYSYRQWPLSPIPWLSQDVEKQSKCVLLQVILYISLNYVISIKNIKQAKSIKQARKNDTLASEMKQTQNTKIRNKGRLSCLITGLTKIKKYIYKEYYEH